MLRSRARLLVLAACVAVVVATAWYAGSRFDPPAPAPPSGAVRLGPEPGEDVAAYVARLSGELPAPGTAVLALVWGVQPVVSDTPMKLLGTVDVPFGQDVIPFTAYQLFVVPGIAILTLVGLAWFLRRTLTGRVITAVTTDREAATAMGINAARVTMLTFTFGAALAALGGALSSPTASLVPGIGASTIVLSFAVVATAGLG